MTIPGGANGMAGCSAAGAVSHPRKSISRDNGAFSSRKRANSRDNTAISARPDEESMLPILTWDYRSEIAQTFGQRAKLLIDDVNDEVRVHPEVLMHDDVAQTGDRGPRDVGHPLSRLVRQRTDCLTDHREVAQNCVVSHRGEPIGATEVGSIILTTPDRVEDVGKPLLV